MATPTLPRHRDGATIETDSATEANDLVANGIAKLVNRPAHRTATTTTVRRKRPVETDEH